MATETVDVLTPESEQFIEDLLLAATTGGMDIPTLRQRLVAIERQSVMLREALAVVLRAYDYRASSHGMAIQNEGVLAQIENARRLVSEPKP